MKKACIYYGEVHAPPNNLFFVFEIISDTVNCRGKFVRLRDCFDLGSEMNENLVLYLAVLITEADETNKHSNRNTLQHKLLYYSS
jgi:hypothetical protein